MTGRRRVPRFITSSSWNASLQTREEVVLERADEHEIWARSPTPMRRGEGLTLEIATGGLRLDVRVLHSEAVVVDGSSGHRIHLRILDSEDADSNAPGFEGGSAS